MNRSDYVNFMSYFGGKYNLLGDLMNQVCSVANKTKPHTFMDCFGGSGSCSINARMCGYIFPNVTYNEKNPDVCSILKIAKDKETAYMMYRILHQIEKTGGVDEALYEAARLRLEFDDITQQERAYQASIIAWCSFNSAWSGKSNARIKYFESYISRLLDVWMYLRHVDIMNRDAFELLDIYGKDPKVLKFLDPPYHPLCRNPHDKVYGEYDFIREDHKKLVQKLCDCTNWILCGYDPLAYGCEDYLPLEEAGAKKVLLGDYHLGSSASHGNPIKKAEYLWIKY